MANELMNVYTSAGQQPLATSPAPQPNDLSYIYQPQQPMPNMQLSATPTGVSGANVDLINQLAQTQLGAQQSALQNAYNQQMQAMQPQVQQLQQQYRQQAANLSSQNLQNQQRQRELSAAMGLGAGQMGSALASIAAAGQQGLSNLGQQYRQDIGGLETQSRGMYDDYTNSLIQALADIERTRQSQLLDAYYRNLANQPVSSGSGSGGGGSRSSSSGGDTTTDTLSLSDLYGNTNTNSNGFPWSRETGVTKRIPSSATPRQPTNVSPGPSFYDFMTTRQDALSGLSTRPNMRSRY